MADYVVLRTNGRLAAAKEKCAKTWKCPKGFVRLRGEVVGGLTLRG